MGLSQIVHFLLQIGLEIRGGLLFLVLDLHLAFILELIKGKGFENVGIISEIESVTCTFAEKDVDGKSM